MYSFSSTFVMSFVATNLFHFFAHVPRFCLVLKEIIFKEVHLGFSFTKGRLINVPCMPCNLSGNSLNELMGCVFGIEFRFNCLGWFLTIFFFFKSF